MNSRKELKLDFKLSVLLLLLANLLILFDRLFLALVIPGNYYTAFFVALILYLTLFATQLRAILLISLIGLSLDLQAAAVLGPGMFAAVGLYYVFSLLAPSLYLTSNLVLIFVGFVAVIVFYILNYLVQHLFHLPLLWQFSSLLLMAGITGLFTPIAFSLFHKYFARS